MFPSTFPQSNHVFDKPAGMTDRLCEALCVFCGVNPEGFPIVVSCWKPTAEELAEINRTGRVWLMTWGRTMPPVTVLGLTPFIEDRPHPAEGGQPTTDE